MALVGASQPQDELLLCANDPVPEPFTIRHHHRTDAVTQTWLVREAAAFRVAPPPSIAADVFEILVLLCTRIAAELGAVFPFAMQDMVELGVRIMLGPEGARWTHVHYDAFIAALPHLGLYFYPVAHACMLSVSQAHSADERTCVQLTQVLRMIYERVRRDASPETACLVGDPRSLIPTHVAQILQTQQDTLRACYVAYLCILFAMLDEAPLDDAWLCLHDVDDPAWQHAYLSHIHIRRCRRQLTCR